MPPENQLAAALRTLNCVGVIAFDSLGREICRVGPVEDVAGQGLFRALFSGQAEVQRLRDSLEGQLLPQIWSQGTTDCFVSRLPNGVLYGVFSQIPRDPVGLYRASQEAARVLDPLLLLSSDDASH